MSTDAELELKILQRYVNQHRVGKTGLILTISRRWN